MNNIDYRQLYLALEIENKKLKEALKNTSEKLVSVAENPFQNEEVLKVLNENEKLLSK